MNYNQNVEAQRYNFVWEIAMQFTSDDMNGFPDVSDTMSSKAKTLRKCIHSGSYLLMIFSELIRPRFWYDYIDRRFFLYRKSLGVKFRCSWRACPRFALISEMLCPQEHIFDMCQVGALLTLQMSSESYMSISLELLMGVLKNTEILHFTSVFPSSNKNVDMNGFRSLNTNQKQ